MNLKTLMALAIAAAIDRSNDGRISQSEFSALGAAGGASADKDARGDKPGRKQ